MATAFPTALDSFVNPTASSNMSDAPVLHHVQHANLNDAVRAMQVYIGTTGSVAATDLTGKLLGKTDYGHGHSVSVISGAQASLVSGSNIKTVGGYSLLGSGDVPITGGAAATVIAASTVIPLDNAGAGKQMTEQTLTASSTFTFTGQVEGGNCSFSLIGNGTAVPNLAAFTNAGGYAYVATAGARNIYSAIYSYGTPLLYGVAGTAVTPAPTFVSQTAPAGTVGTAYSYTFAALNTTSYALASGTLPAGITLNTATGAISGTPTTAATSAFVISATGLGGTTNSTAQSVVVAAGSTNQRFLGLDNGNIVESGTGPYSYGDSTGGNGRAGNSNLKFPAGVAASLTFKNTGMAGIPNALFFSIGFDTDAATLPPIAEALNIGCGGGTLYSGSAGATNTASAQTVAVGTFVRIRRDATNMLYGETSPDNITWTTTISVQGANINYWPKMYMNPTTGGLYTFQSFSNTGMN